MDKWSVVKLSRTLGWSGWVSSTVGRQRLLLCQASLVSDDLHPNLSLEKTLQLKLGRNQEYSRIALCIYILELLYIYLYTANQQC